MPAQTAASSAVSAADGLKPVAQAQLQKTDSPETIYIVQENRHSPLVVYKKNPTFVLPGGDDRSTASEKAAVTVAVAKKKPEVQKTLSLIDEMTPEVSARLARKPALSMPQKASAKAVVTAESTVLLPATHATQSLPTSLAKAEAAGEIVILKTFAPPAQEPTTTALLKPEIPTPAILKASPTLTPAKPVLVATASKTNKHQAISKFILQYNRNLGMSAALAIADHILKLSEHHKLDYKMVTSLIAVESGFRPRVVSCSGAVGLGQLKPSTAKTFGVTNLYDPAQNLKAATGYLRMLTNRYGGSLQHALAAYLMGPGAVKRNGVTASAQGYIRRINQKSAQLSMVLRAHGAN